MQAQLFVLAGPDAGKRFSLEPGVSLVIGRGRDSGIQLTDPQVSRLHCRVDVEGQQVVLTDLSSRGGSFVNGKRVTRQPLQRNDVIKVGDTQLRLETQELADQATLPPPEAPPAAPSVLPAERLHELTGSRLGRYAVGPMLAKGQTGLVFRGLDTKDNSPVALKVLWPEFSRDDKEVRRFVRAMRTMLPLHHPHLVTLHGAGRTGPYCWIVMEFVDGESVTHVIQRRGSAGALDWREALRVAVHINRALVFAHHHNIIHRNITPQNILIRSSDRVAKLGDLMLAKASEGKLAEQITRPGELLGDARYMSPERTSGDPGQVDARSDIYSLGATIYALLAGRPPLEGRSFVETILKIRQAQPEALRPAHPSIPVAFEALVLKMLAKRPEDRFQKAVELLPELDRIVKAEGVVI